VMDLLDNRKIVNKRSQAEGNSDKSDAEEEDKENKPKTDTSFAQKKTIEPKCVCCGESHYIKSCPIKNKFAYDDWFKIQEYRQGSKVS